MMNTRRFISVFLAVGWLGSNVGWAWSGGGHMVIAAEAYRELPRGVKAKVNELLTSHPAYDRWRAGFEPGSPNLDLPLFVFMKASTWPDEIRRKGADYDHPHWHYVDYPLRPPKFELEPGPSPDDDILYGIRQAENALRQSTNLVERAVYLSWLIHLIGDLHQPLHCASLVSEAYPAGDKGGNDFYIKPASKGIRLHSFWDGLLGTRTNPGSQLNEAIRIRKEHPWIWLAELKRKPAKEWSLESRALAVDRVYLGGKLKGSKTPDGAPALPKGYTKTAKKVAEKQAALAAHRLAEEIRNCLK
jgi:hypothetical protein